MKRSLIMLALLIGANTPFAANAQISFDAAENRSFASENAILDTSIPFAIGAREAQQALRGSFGWPNFQEGLVEGVYFRFDPDGYARFAPTPRLDVDVFEVICRPRTYACAARKEGFEMFLNERGQIQMKLSSVAAGDTFHVAEGVSEIQLPERILQPLDVQLETLLSSGGELVARRGGNEVTRVSLAGFSAVSAYLRWIVSRQDYSVLPRGWPIPNGAGDLHGSAVTKAGNWASPMPQPHVVAAPSVLPHAQVGARPPNGVSTSGESIELRAEVEALRRLLLEQDNAQNQMQTPAPVVVPIAAADSTHTSGQVGELMATIAMLRADIEALKAGSANDGSEATYPQYPVSPSVAAHAPMPADSQQTAQRLQFLMEELGLDMQTAVAVLQMAPDSHAQLADPHAPTSAMPSVETKVLYQTDVVDQILAELEADIAAPMTLDDEGIEGSRPSIEEYQLLSRYFASAALPELRAMADDN
ncbi:hypothetical protein BXY66_2441 [Shimia isoporae]|uniref:Uncharacterized protein n=1 Tax=Shimia isoporae TaxID=647720 RepID=A0A4R1N531_9RHOB|nr:hypothetical protein [Shimia isoporae]TCL01132.1 hypothetical protein BXY66_2441 [Shimia isoporae]